MASRPGTAALGNEYEILVPAWLSLRLLQDPDVVDFSMKTNVKGFGALDDLVVWILLKTGKSHNIAVQLKHKATNARKLQVSSLEAKEGPYSLHKYCQDYHKLPEKFRNECHFLLYTNLDFDPNNIKKLNIFDMFPEDCCPVKKWFDTNESNEHIYKFRLKNDTLENGFFQQFSLYVSQKNVESFNNEIKRIIRNVFCGDDIIAASFVAVFRDWYYANYSKIEMKAKTVKYQLLYLLLKPYLLNSLQDGSSDDQKVQLLVEAAKEFDITIVDLEEEFLTRCLRRFWAILEEEKIFRIGKENNLLLKSDTELSPELSQKVLGFCQTLIVRVDGRWKNSIYSIINLLHRSSQVKILLVGRNIETKSLDKSLKIFRSLHQLSHASHQLYSRILKEFEVSLQARSKMPIESLVKLDEELAKFIMVEDLLKMIDKDFVVGEMKEEMPRYYMSRKLRKMDHLDQLQDESNLTEELENRVNFICAKPGMGKSVMMKYLKNHCPEGYWAIKIDFKDHQAKFRKKAEFQTILKYFLDCTLNNFKYDHLSAKLMEIFVRTKKCFFYWDGLDELDNNYWNSAIKIIQEFHKKGYRQWISARYNLQNRVEKALKISAYDIEEIDIPAQREYIRNRLSKCLDLKTINNIIISLYCGTNLAINNNILGPPLQLHMITEILLLNRNNSIEFVKEISVLSCMYRSFVDGKCLHYLQKINGIQDQHLLTSAKNHQIKIYQVLALKSCFKSANLTNFLDSGVMESLQETSTNSKTIQNSGDYLGIVVKILDDETAIFEHNTYMEFFSAWWLAENFTKIFKFQTILFKEEYRNVRYFFDLILGERSRSHVAVLYKNFDEVEDLQQEDPAGRTPLHLACSWGISHPLLKMVKTPIVTGTNRITRYFTQAIDLVTFRVRTLPSLEDVQHHSAVVGKLSEKFDPMKVDSLFGWTAGDYADETLSLCALEGIASKSPIKLEYMKNFSNMYLVSYYCVEYDYKNLFEQIADKLPFFYVDRPRRSFYDYACELMRVVIARRILSNPIYHRAVEKVSEVHYKIQTGRIKKGKLSKKAISNSYDQKGELTLHIAIKAQHEDLIKYLALNAYIDVNQKDINGRNAKQIKNYHRFQGILDKSAKWSNILKRLTYEREINMLERKDLKRFMADITDPNQRHLNRETHLMRFAERGNLNMVRYLVEKLNADLNLSDRLGETAVLKALKNGKLDIVEYLIKQKVVVKEKYKTEKNILTFCARNGYWEILRLLIDEYQFENFENTAIELAALDHRYDIVKILLKKTQIWQKPHLLRFAAYEGLLKFVKILLEDDNLDIDEEDSLGESALMKAKNQKHFEIVECLNQKKLAVTKVYNGIQQ